MRVKKLFKIEPNINVYYCPYGQTCVLKLKDLIGNKVFYRYAYSRGQVLYFIRGYLSQKLISSPMSIDISIDDIKEVL